MIKTINFRGDLTDNSAKKEALQSVRNKMENSRRIRDGYIKHVHVDPTCQVMYSFLSADYPLNWVILWCAETWSLVSHKIRTYVLFASSIQLLYPYKPPFPTCWTPFNSSHEFAKLLYECV